jgi:CheY-like chemotaxis protein
MAAKTKILMIEDSKLTRMVIERSLSRAGYAVSSAADGEQGLIAASEGAPDVILLDMMLPKVSGPEVLKALKSDAKTKAIPVVVLSSLSQINATRLLADGACAFVEKSSVGLDKGTEPLLFALAEILRDFCAS